jgi:putative glycerol-1-phosphate prenyltransferase
VSILQHIEKRHAEAQRSLAVLIDPDKSSADLLDRVLSLEPDYIFAGGSLLTASNIDKTIRLVKANTDIPVVIFPGSPEQVDAGADALLFLSLISGRNAEYLIGNQVLAAPRIKEARLEAIPTGYMLVEGEHLTTAQYVSQTMPIPRKKPEIAACTALAGEMLGLRLMYLDAGSGASHPVPANMITAVRETVNVPIIVGGGIRSAEEAQLAWESGADIIVIGTAAEQALPALKEIAGRRLAV